jgi:hypothetical protein
LKIVVVIFLLGNHLIIVVEGEVVFPLVQAPLVHTAKRHLHSNNRSSSKDVG